MKIYKIKDIKKIPDSEVEILAEISEGHLEKYKEKAFKKIKEVVELPGFRVGFRFRPTGAHTSHPDHQRQRQRREHDPQHLD